MNPVILQAIWTQIWTWILQFTFPLLKSSPFSSIELIPDISNLFIPPSFPYLLGIFHLISHSSDHLSAWWFPSAFIPLRSHSSSIEYMSLFVAGFRDLFVLRRFKILFLFWQSINHSIEDIVSIPSYFGNTLWISINLFPAYFWFIVVFLLICVGKNGYMNSFLAFS